MTGTVQLTPNPRSKAMPNLNELIERLSNGDPDDTADAVFDALDCPQKWRDTFGPLLRNECRRSIRSDVRALENASGPAGHAPSPEGAGRAEMLSKSVAVGGGRYVIWGEMTVADHRERISMLMQMRNGVDVTITRHAEAIDMIEAAGATCLNDVLVVAA